jgi:thioredoxin
MSKPRRESENSVVLSVACLCAAWCGTCETYRATLDRVVAEFVAAGHARPPRWIDIEDEADLLGDYDVETFPTLLIHDDRRIYFAGPLTPQPETLRRLLQKLVESPAAVAAPREAAELVQRLRAGADAE